MMLVACADADNIQQPARYILIMQVSKKIHFLKDNLFRKSVNRDKQPFFTVEGGFNTGLCHPKR